MQFTGFNGIFFRKSRNTYSTANAHWSRLFVFFSFKLNKSEGKHRLALSNDPLFADQET
jgi:hypothetical protein